jgi:hypothetical protein
LRRTAGKAGGARRDHPVIGAEAEADIRHRRLSIGDKHVGRHITAALTDAELGIVIDHDDRTGGLDVPVFDGDGARYDFKCVYAEDTGCYRLAVSADYERFMVANNMVGKELFMEVWTLRSPALRIGGNKSAVNDHPDGALGMIILFFDLGTDGLGDDDLSIRTIMHWLKHCLKSTRRLRTRTIYLVILKAICLVILRIFRGD